MKYQNCKTVRWSCYYKKFFLTLIFIFVFLNTQKFIEAGNEEIVYKEQNLMFFYYPPNKIRQDNFLQIKEEVAKINTIVLHLQNYLELLIKLKKIPENYMLYVFYGNYPIKDFYNQKNTLVITELGWNTILQGINKILKSSFDNVNKYLIENIESLAKCRVSYKYDKSFEQLGNIKNLSHKLQEHFSEEDFKIIEGENKAAVVVRSTFHGNKILYIPVSDDQLAYTILNESNKGSYNFIELSPNGKYIAYSEKGMLYIYDFISKNSISVLNKLVNDKSNEDSFYVIGYDWSYDSKYIVCFYLDKKLNKRDILLYNLENKSSYVFPDVINGWNFEKDSVYAHAFWSPDSNYLLFTDGFKIYVYSVGAKKMVAKPIDFQNQIVELIWNNNSNAFATLEVSGKFTNKAEFNSQDYTSWTIRRWNILENTVEEDKKQRYDSNKFIKLVGFWSLDRILFLEGHFKLSAFTTNFIFDFKNKLSVKLTPTPTNYKNDKGETLETGYVELPIQFCYVMRNIDSKNKNVYDCGLNGSNYIYLDRQYNHWFIGFRKPEELPKFYINYALLYTPYPFQEYNKIYFTDISENKMESILRIIKVYNIRKLEVDENFNNIFFLSNNNGPINLWYGDKDAFCKACERINAISTNRNQTIKNNIEDKNLEINRFER